MLLSVIYIISFHQRFHCAGSGASPQFCEGRTRLTAKASLADLGLGQFPGLLAKQSKDGVKLTITPLQHVFESFL